MNENDKETLKHFGIIMLAALAGGILGALIVMSHHSFKAQKHIHIYAPPMLINRAERDFTNLEKDFDKFEILGNILNELERVYMKIL